VGLRVADLHAELGGGDHLHEAPLDARGREDADAFAGPDAEVDEPESDLTDALADLRVDDVPPRAVDLVPRGNLIAVPLGGKPDRVGDRLETRRPGGRLMRPASSRTVRQERDSMVARAVRAGDVGRALGGGAGGLRRLRGLSEVCEEEGLVDPALEDRDAHFHALRDDFLALQACLASELGGRQVIRHWRDPPLDVCNVLHI
jgi:hypothetical protein